MERLLAKGRRVVGSAKTCSVAIMEKRAVITSDGGDDGGDLDPDGRLDLGAAIQLGGLVDFTGNGFQRGVHDDHVEAHPPTPPQRDVADGERHQVGIQERGQFHAELPGQEVERANAGQVQETPPQERADHCRHRVRQEDGSAGESTGRVRRESSRSANNRAKPSISGMRMSP